MDVKKYLKNPLKAVRPLAHYGLFNFLPDKQYLKLVYRGEMGKMLNISNPKSYNEKLQWLKLYDQKEEYKKYVDKYEVRKIIEAKIGKEYLIPLLGVYESVEEINWSSLPNQFVLKCTHGSSCNIICTDKESLDIEESKKKLNKWMNKSWYWFGREWVYKDVKPRIICEAYMVDESGDQLKDYKFFCFDGKVKASFIASDRNSNTKFDFFDKNFNKLPIKQHYPNSDYIIKKPSNYDEMYQLSEKLSTGFPHVRVDFYSINGKTYFGEVTFFHFSGFKNFEPNKYDLLFGEWLTLPSTK